MASEHDRRGALTDTQSDLLRRAVREGYFRVPREVTLVDLATACEISDREASQQLRLVLDVLVRDAMLSEQHGVEPNE
ncbi:MAG: helix-turn-helix domain-containing protein [Halobacteriales archaeon]|nr:helix-turn-helix domain-containing protein [Halobacteriales archaeon]